MDAVITVLQENPLLLLFLVAAIGYPVGRVKVGGASLGVAAVLFVGLAFGALDPELKLPEVVYQMGLVLFVYTLGLASGSIFFASLGRRGLRYNLLVAGGLVLGAILAAGAATFFRFNGPTTAGMYAGGLTNTPALAGVVEHIQASGLGEPALSEPVVAYSLTYPVSVLGMILVVVFFQRIWKINYASEARRVTGSEGANEPIQNRTICITQPVGMTVAEIVRKRQWNVVFGRLRRDGTTSLTTGQTVLLPGDLVSLIGTEEDLEAVIRTLGDANCGERLEFDVSEYDKRRIFVSNQQVAGRRLRDLDIIGRFGALITRIRRGDMELLPHGHTVLMPGDQVRVVAPRDQMEPLTRMMGDSYRAVSEIDILTFSLGLALGLLLGMVPIPLPGGVTLRLGIAGGPLIAALVFGALGRTGPLVWTLPYGANLSIRQIGLIFFLAGIGTRAGYSFFSTIFQGSGIWVLAGGLVITVVTGAVTLWVGYRLLKIPMGLLIGILAGLQTQPALLGFALEQTKDELPNTGYATIYPIAMVIKILLAQGLLILFQ
jgi:putative transport protein